MKKKNIAFVIYSLESGGAERVVATLANLFTSSFNVTIITLVNSNSVYELDNRIERRYCLENTSYKPTIWKSIKYNLQIYVSIRKILKEQGIDLAISFMTTTNVLTIWAAKSLNIPCIVSERSNPYIYTQNRIWSFLVKISLPKADYLIVQSMLAKEYYNRIMNTDRILCLPNPLSPALISKKKSDINKKNIILNVGRLDSNKSQDLLIRAFANIDHSNWQLVFVGEGPLLNSYQKLAATLGVSSSIIFAGKKSDVSTYYNQSKIFAFTSKSEGFPNVLIEAMYFELACISTDCQSGPSELIENGVNGYLIPIDDQDSLENYLKSLMTSPLLCEKFGENAQKTASAYKVEMVISKWNQIIQELI